MEIFFNDQLDDWHFDRIVSTGDEGPDPTVAARVGIIDDEGVRIQLNVLSSAGTPCFHDARCVDHIAYIGFGHSLFVFNTRNGTLARHQLDGYFGHMYGACDFENLPTQLSVLVTSASEVLAFSRNGELVWMRPNLGIDGVLLRAVNEKQIDGEGEYDPPNGWRKFTVILDADAIA